MSSSPFRTRRVSQAETRRILKRAAELADLDRSTANEGETFTEAELAQRLTALGLPDDAIRRAMGDPESVTPVSNVEATRVVREEEIDGMLPVDRHEIVADTISAAMQLPGRVEVVGNKLKWTMGLSMDTSVTVHSREGRTLVRIEETLANKGQLIVGGITVAAFAGIFGMVPGIAIAKILGDSAGNATRSIVLIAAFAIACALAAVVGLRRMFRRRVRNRTSAIGEAMDRISTVVRNEVVRKEPIRQEVVPVAKKARIAAPKPEARAPIAEEFEVDAAAESDAEAEADAAAEAEAAREKPDAESTA